MRVAVVGLGKLGVPLAAVLASKGHEVVGVDLDPLVVATINAGTSPVEEPGVHERITSAGSRLLATGSFEEAVEKSDIAFVIVPTPSDDRGLFSNRFVLDAVSRIGAALKVRRGYYVVNITSTVMPGSTGGEIRTALEMTSGRKVGPDMGLTYNPEFIALGSVVRDLLRPDMLLIGESDPRAGDVLLATYSAILDSTPPIHRMNWINAEIAKIAINTYVTTKISYANMLAEICEGLPHADIDVVTTALGSDSRIGSKYLRGALGYGGPCFPRDNVALSALARTIGRSADVAIATDMVNRRQAQRVVNLVHLLRPEGPVAVLGMAYKVDTPVVDESQGVEISRMLAELGYTVLIFDPLALSSAATALMGRVSPRANAAEAVAEADVVVVANPIDGLKTLPLSVFTSGEQRKVVIDCWRILPTSVADVADVLLMGRGPD
ncbi:MAG: nucleotide sugar dehydrogenase [Reyranellaceae bacterium]